MWKFSLPVGQILYGEVASLLFTPGSYRVKLPKRLYKNLASLNAALWLKQDNSDWLFCSIWSNLKGWTFWKDQSIRYTTISKENFLFLTFTIAEKVESSMETMFETFSFSLLTSSSVSSNDCLLPCCMKLKLRSTCTLFLSVMLKRQAELWLKHSTTNKKRSKGGGGKRASTWQRSIKCILNEPRGIQ